MLLGGVMPRKARFYLPNVPVHVVQRGNNRQAVFYEDENYQQYKIYLSDAAKKYGCKIHAYVLMTNHVHLLVTADASQGVSNMMQHIGRCYVPYINKRYKRSGTLWEGRYKSNLVEAAPYLIACMRYIEENPVRANMVSKAEAYDWSSYAGNALGLSDPLLAPHVIYNQLVANGYDDYIKLFSSTSNHCDLNEIRRCVQTGTPLVGKKFLQQIEQSLGRKMGYRERGRPRKGI